MSPLECERYPCHCSMHLLSVKGTLVTVVCDGLTRQRAFDTLAKYNVLTIGTPGSTHVTQSLTLPILRSLDANTPGLQSINHLLQQSRHPSTKQPSEPSLATSCPWSGFDLQVYNHTSPLSTVYTPTSAFQNHLKSTGFLSLTRASARLKAHSGRNLGTGRHPTNRTHPLQRHR